MTSAGGPDDAVPLRAGVDESGLPADHPSRYRQRHQPQHVQEAQYRQVVHDSGMLELFEPLVCDHRGSQSRLSLEGMHIAMLSAAANDKTYKRADVTAAAARITDYCAAEVGIDDRNANGPISYSTVWRLLHRFEDAMVDASAHPYYGKHGWLDEHGMYALAYLWSDAMIQASIPPQWRDKITSVAIDGTCWWTWAKNRVFKPQEDIVAEHAQQRADRFGLAEPDLTDLENPCGTAPGEVGPDGRVTPTLCPTARWGYRTKTPKDQRDRFLGHDTMLGVTVRDCEYRVDAAKCKLGDDVPQFVTGVRVIPASANPAPPASALAQAFKRGFRHARDVIADRGITHKRSFVRACHELDLHVTMDYDKTEVAHPKEPTFGRNQNMYYQHVGMLLPGWLDGSVVEPPELGAVDPATGEKVTEAEVMDWFVERAKLRCTLNQRLPSGDYQYRTPLAAGRISTEHTRHTAKTGATEYPSDIVYPEKFFNVPIEDADRLQRTPWGTPAWDDDYGRRELVETGNSKAKDENGLGADSCRSFKFVAHVITATVINVIHNLEEARRFEVTAPKRLKAAKKKQAAAKNHQEKRDNGTPPDDVTVTSPGPSSSTEAADITPTTAAAPQQQTPAANGSGDNGQVTGSHPTSHKRKRRTQRRRQPAQRQPATPTGRSPPRG